MQNKSAAMVPYTLPPLTILAPPIYSTLDARALFIYDFLNLYGWIIRAKPTKDHQVSEVSEFILTAGILRTAIRAKLRRGASRRGISVLICTYTPQDAKTERMDGGVYRVPVELIPLERRLSFLEALNELPNRVSVVDTRIAPLAA
jgi:hypothetical protein